MAVTGPTLARRRLGKELRRMRLEARKSVPDVVQTRIISKSALHRVEGGEVKITVATASALARFYGADNETTDRIEEHARRTLERGWWEEYGAGPMPGFVTYVGLEADADAIRTYQALVVPGLLQTPQYAATVERAGRLDPDEDSIQRSVALRIERQTAALERGVHVVAIIDAGAVQRLVGTPTITEHQVTHLRTLATRPQIDVRILPWSAGPHPGDLGRFTLLSFDDPADPTVAYVETYVGAHYLEAPEQVARQEAVFKRLCELSVPIEEYP